MAIESWNLVEIRGTWTNHHGGKLPGRYEVKVPSRLTNYTDDIIIPAGVFAAGDLSVVEGEPSLSLLVPPTDDPDIDQTNWLLEVNIVFSGAQNPETYHIEVPVANRPISDGGSGLGINLRQIAISQNIPLRAVMYRLGGPGGLVLYTEDGKLVNADGTPIEGGTGASTWSELGGKPNVIAAGDTPQDARDAIGARAAGSVPAADITGTLAEARIPTLAQAKIAGLEGALAGKATPADVTAAVNALVGAAPGALDTLAELAAALGGDANFASTVTAALGARLRVDTAQALTGPQQTQGRTNLAAASATQGGKADTAVQTATWGGSWPARPSTSGVVLWIGGPATRPANAVTGDIHWPDAA